MYQRCYVSFYMLNSWNSRYIFVAKDRYLVLKKKVELKHIAHGALGNIFNDLRGRRNKRGSLVREEDEKKEGIDPDYRGAGLCSRKVRRNRIYVGIKRYGLRCREFSALSPFIRVCQPYASPLFEQNFYRFLLPLSQLRLVRFHRQHRKSITERRRSLKIKRADGRY